MRDPMFQRQKTARPYAGRSGSSGSAASHERADAEDESGVTTHRQARVLDLLDQAGPLGMTWVEVGRAELWHHGQSTGVLSVLHKEKKIMRLKFGRRDRSSVYVLPQYVEGRVVEDQGRRPKVTEDHAVLGAFLAAYEAEKRTRDAVVDALAADVNELSNRNSELKDRVAVLQRALATVDQAHRIAVALRAPEQDEQDLLATLQERLASAAERDDQDVLRVRLGTLRLIAAVLRRHRSAL